MSLNNNRVVAAWNRTPGERRAMILARCAVSGQEQETAVHCLIRLIVLLVSVLPVPARHQALEHLRGAGEMLASSSDARALH